MSGESGVYEVGMLLQDAQEFAGRPIRGADALFPVPDGGKGESQCSGKFALAEPKLCPQGFDSFRGEV